MKRLLLLLIVLSIGCNKEDEDQRFDGSAASLEDLFSEEVVQALEDLNFTVNQGVNPPSLEGTFFISPVILTDTNVETDVIGARFFDQRYTFFNQDNGQNTIDFDGVQLTLSGVVASELEGTGSFISGNDDSFSIFLVVDNENVSSGAMAQIAYAITGAITTSGIVNFEIAIIMLDNMGNPTAEFIENGKGRRFIDEDGLSDIENNLENTSNKSAYKAKNIFNIW